MFKKIRIAASEKISLYGNLSTMLSGGITLVEAVDLLIEDSKGSMLKVLTGLKAGLMEGKRIHKSLEEFPDAFDKVETNLIKAAEEAGTLEVTLKDLRLYTQNEQEFLDKVKLALIYPAVIGCLFLGVMLVMLIVVMPKISMVFTRLKMELPLPTRILIAMSNLLVNHTWEVVVGLVSLSIIMAFLFSKYRKAFLGLFFSLPIINKLVQLIDLTRFSRSMHLLLSSGIPITTALDMTKDIAMLKSTTIAINRSREMVLSGKNLSSGFHGGKKTFPMIVVRLIEAGEKSGTLEKSMQEIAEHLDYKVSNTLKSTVALIEPLMLVVVGVFVGGLIMSIIGPIYGMISQVGSTTR